MSPAAAEGIQSARLAAARLTGLVNDLLDTARLDSGGLTFDTEPPAIAWSIASVSVSVCAGAAMTAARRSRIARCMSFQFILGPCNGLWSG